MSKVTKQDVDALQKALEQNAAESRERLQARVSALLVPLEEDRVAEVKKDFDSLY